MTLTRTIKAILLKDLLTELRTKQLLPTMIVLGLLIAWTFRITTDPTPANPSSAVAVLLVSLLFSAILACDKAFAAETHNDCISSLLLAPVDPGDIYIAKLLVNLLWLCLVELILVPAVVLLFKLPTARWPQIILVLLLCNLGVSSVGTLLGAAVQQTRASMSLLTILLMAVLCPLMLPASFALMMLFGPADAHTLAGSSFWLIADPSSAIGYMVAFDAIFVTVCWLLFGLVVRE